MSTSIKIQDRLIGLDYPVYFIADIAANHDGDIQRAKDLIFQASEAGADAAKFQHFLAEEIVSDRGFKDLGTQRSHQSAWKKSVFEVYREAALPRDWTDELKETCDRAGIHFFSAPYDMQAVDLLESRVPAYKIGSGDITWPEMLEYIAGKGKPVLLATGAADIGEVQRAADTILRINRELVLMQCNTNYTGQMENFKYLQLNVLKTFADMYPQAVLGLSDHSPGHAAVLGAVALGARVIEKHFTDDKQREGPDHAFSMNPRDWAEMVEKTRQLEMALGDGCKRVQENEQDTVIVQRRGLRFRVDVPAGAVIERDHIILLRPATPGVVEPRDLPRIIGRTLRRNVPADAAVQWTDFE